MFLTPGHDVGRVWGGNKARDAEVIIKRRKNLQRYMEFVAIKGKLLFFTFGLSVLMTISKPGLATRRMSWVQVRPPYSRSSGISG